MFVGIIHISGLFRWLVAREQPFFKVTSLLLSEMCYRARARLHIEGVNNVIYTLKIIILGSQGTSGDFDYSRRAVEPLDTVFLLSFCFKSSLCSVDYTETSPDSEMMTGHFCMNCSFKQIYHEVYLQTFPWPFISSAVLLMEIELSGS